MKKSSLSESLLNQESKNEAAPFGGPIISNNKTRMSPPISEIENKDASKATFLPSITMQIDDPLRVRAMPYTKGDGYNKAKCSGTAFVINRVTFGWRELTEFKSLDNMLNKRRFQQHLRPVYHCIEPSLITKELNTPNSIADDLEQSSAFITMAVCLPCYNEEWCEMSGTLRSLADNILFHRKKLTRSFQIHVVVFIIQDGWGKASESLKKGITEEIGCPCPEWIESIQTPSKGKNEIEDGCITIIAPDAEVYYPAGGLDDQRGSGATFHPIFITKSRNAQKFNSHLQFFALCNILRPNCVFLTDCGTLYRSNCLTTLVEYLREYKDEVAGVTARQRVMNEVEIREVQEYPYWWQKENGIHSYNTTKSIWDKISWWFSPAPLQGFEFESTFLLNTAMFNVVGALPVLPGPCQLIWWDRLESRGNKDSIGESPLDMYFRQLNLDFSKSGIVKTSLLLAEDRVLSFSLIFRTMGMKTVWVNGATFSYEPMMTWVQLLGQRRRWINGTIAAYAYYLIDPKGRAEFGISSLENSKVLPFLWRLQLYQSILQVISPAFFCIALFEAVLQNIPNPSNVNNASNPVARDLTIAYFMVYFLWVVISMSLGKRPEGWKADYYTSTMEKVYIFFSLLNAVACAFIFINIITSSSSYVKYVMLFLWVVPFCLALLLSRTSAWLHDFSWGNRDSDAGASAKKDKEREFFIFTLQANFLSVTINLLLVVAYSYFVNKFGHLIVLLIPLSVILFFPMLVQIIFCIFFIFLQLFQVLTCEKSHHHKRQAKEEEDQKLRSILERNYEFNSACDLLEKAKVLEKEGKINEANKAKDEGTALLIGLRSRVKSQ